MVKSHGKEENMKFRERLIIHEDKLNDTDDQIAEYINQNQEKFCSQSIQKSAEILFTVPNTLVRFSKKLGYEGFSDMKHELKNENSSFTIEGYKEEFNILDNITKTMDSVDIDAINKACRKILETRNTYCIGMGDSIYYTELLRNNLRCIGIKAEYFQHRHDMIYSMRNIESKDVVVVISVSGETPQLIEAVNTAKERGAYIISITNVSINTIAELSNINLHFFAHITEKNGYNTTDRVGILILIRLISETLWKNACE